MRIQAYTPSELDELEPGSAYIFKNVKKAQGEYTVCDGTQIEGSEGDFGPFDAIESVRGVDVARAVIGAIVDVEDAKKVGEAKQSLLRNVHLADDSGTTIRLTLWGDTATGFKGIV